MATKFLCLEGSMDTDGDPAKKQNYSEIRNPPESLFSHSVLFHQVQHHPVASYL